MQMTTLDENRYADLLREKRPRIIRSEADNESALREIEVLVSRGDSASPEEAELLALMVALVDRYMNRRSPPPATSPIEVLRKLVAPGGLKERAIVALFPFERPKAIRTAKR
jgi:antitoxin component HigA of HigAB toxin-antitoxin module